MQAANPLCSKAIDKTKSEFNKLDKNADRKLDVKEFQTWLLRRSPKMTDSDVRSAFTKVDKDDDDAIDFEEFVVADEVAMQNDEERHHPWPDEGV